MKKTLKEIGDFFGIPQGSLEVAGYGGPRNARLAAVSRFFYNGQEPASMQNIIQTLQNLTPMTLEAQIVGDQSGEEPFNPIIRLNASGGLHLRTFINLNGN